MELTFSKFVTNHCDPPVLRRLSSECVASMLTHPLCWMPAHTQSSCSLIGCREMMLESITLDKSGYDFNIWITAFTSLLHGTQPFLKITFGQKIPCLITSRSSLPTCSQLPATWLCSVHTSPHHLHPISSISVITPHDPSFDTFTSSVFLPSGIMTKILYSYSSLLCRLLWTQ